MKITKGEYYIREFKKAVDNIFNKIITYREVNHSKITYNSFMSVKKECDTVQQYAREYMIAYKFLENENDMRYKYLPLLYFEGKTDSKNTDDLNIMLYSIDFETGFLVTDTERVLFRDNFYFEILDYIEAKFDIDYKNDIYEMIDIEDIVDSSWNMSAVTGNRLCTNYYNYDFQMYHHMAIEYLPLAKKSLSEKEIAKKTEKMFSSVSDKNDYTTLLV